MVEYANAFLMSSCTKASSAPIRIVTPPISAIMFTPPSPMLNPLKNTGYRRAPRYAPATTIVAAWMSADTGVGPAMASGSQVCRKNCPLLPMIPNMSATDATSIRPWLASWLSAYSLMPPMSQVLAAKKQTITPIIRPTSPVLVVRNAFNAASEFGFSSHQWPMSMNEQTQTSSHPTSSCSRLLETTSSSIDAENNDSAA